MNARTKNELKECLKSAISYYALFGNDHTIKWLNDAIAPYLNQDTDEIEFKDEIDQELFVELIQDEIDVWVDDNLVIENQGDATIIDIIEW